MTEASMADVRMTHTATLLKQYDMSQVIVVIQTHQLATQKPPPWHNQTSDLCRELGIAQRHPLPYPNAILWSLIKFWRSKSGVLAIVEPKTTTVATTTINFGRSKTTTRTRTTTTMTTPTAITIQQRIACPDVA